MQDSAKAMEAFTTEIVRVSIELMTKGIALTDYVRIANEYSRQPGFSLDNMNGYVVIKHDATLCR